MSGVPMPRSPLPPALPPCPAATARLRLRRFCAADPRDSEALLAMHRDPRVRALLVDDHALDEPAVLRRFLLGLQRVYARHPGLGIWRADRRLPLDAAALAEAEASVRAGELDAVALDWLQQPAYAFCGWFNLMPMPHDPARVEIGCRLLPQAWGSGLALEGGSGLLLHAFEQLGLDAVWGVCHPQHRSVHAVLLTLGFAPLGVQAYDDVAAAAHFRIDRPAWQSSRRAPLRERQRQALRQLAAA